MGCDIHLWVEVRNPETLAWELVKPSFACGYCADGIVGRDGQCNWCKGTRVVHRFDDRNYTLFSVLADVRNYEKIEPVASVREFPEDLSAGLRAILESEDDDDSAEEKELGWGQRYASPGDHTPSWLTIDEIDRYLRITPKLKMAGMVPLQFWKGWPGTFWTTPGASYARGVWGPTSKVITPAEADDMLARGVVPPDRTHVYVDATWEEDIARAIGRRFVEEFLPACRKLGPGGRVRLVFNFDS